MPTHHFSRRKYKADPRETKRGRQKLLASAETVKHVLSTLDTANCYIESLYEGIDFNANVTRARFENELSKAWLPDGYSQIFRSYVFGPSGFWTMAPLRYAAKLDPFLSLDCASTPSTLAQSKERKGSNFAILQP